MKNVIDILWRSLGKAKIQEFLQLNDKILEYLRRETILPENYGEWFYAVNILEFYPFAVGSVNKYGGYVQRVA